MAAYAPCGTNELGKVLECLKPVAYCGVSDRCPAGALTPNDVCVVASWVWAVVAVAVLLILPIWGFAIACIIRAAKLRPAAVGAHGSGSVADDREPLLANQTLQGAPTASAPYTSSGRAAPGAL